MKLWLWLWLLVPMVGCGFTVTDKGSDFHTSGGISLLYTDWVAPAESNWIKDSYDCDLEAREAVPGLLRLPGRRQTVAERCLTARGYIKR